MTASSHSLRRRILALAVFLLVIPGPAQASPAGEIELLDSSARIDFPESLTFELEAQSTSEIVDAEIEYGVDLLACATDLNRARPDDNSFQPGEHIRAAWTWNMRQTGSLPPGTQIWWRWRMVDADGQETITTRQNLTWLDTERAWQTIAEDDVRLHWYSGNQEFAQSLLQAAFEARQRLAGNLGVEPRREVQIYVFASTDDMREAVLFEAQWTGALAYPDYGVILVGINRQNQEWGRETLAHEIGHILVGGLVSHCYAHLPSWLEEGLAEYGEGPPDEDEIKILQQALDTDSVLNVRTLSDGFSEHTGQAQLSYAQSRSLVAYLIEEHGQARLLSLLDAFQTGYQPDNALLQVYGFDIDGLEAAWRSWIGAAPMSIPTRGPQSTPTPYPTLEPLQLALVAATATPLPTVAPATQESATMQTDPNSTLILVASAGLCLISMTIAGLVTWRFLRRKSSSEAAA